MKGNLFSRARRIGFALLLISSLGSSSEASAASRKALSPARLRYQKFLHACEAIEKAPDTQAAYTLRQVLQVSKKHSCAEFHPGKRGFVFLGDLNLSGREIEDLSPLALFRMKRGKIDLSRNKIQDYSPILRTIQTPYEVGNGTGPTMVDLSQNRISELHLSKHFDSCSLNLSKNRVKDPWALIRLNEGAARLCSLSLQGNISGRGENYDRAIEAVHDVLRAFQTQNFGLLEPRLSSTIQQFAGVHAEGNSADPKKRLIANIRKFWKGKDIRRYEIEEESLRTEPLGDLLRVSFRSELTWYQGSPMEEDKGEDFLIENEMLLDAEGKITRYQEKKVPRALIGMKTERAYKTLSPLKEYLEYPYDPLPPSSLRIPAGEKVLDLNQIVEGSMGNRGGITVRFRKVSFRGKVAWVRERNIEWNLGSSWAICAVDAETGKFINFDEEDEADTKGYRSCLEFPATSEEAEVQENEERFFVWVGESK